MKQNTIIILKQQNVIRINVLKNHESDVIDILMLHCVSFHFDCNEFVSKKMIINLRTVKNIKEYKTCMCVYIMLNEKIILHPNFE